MARGVLGLEVRRNGRVVGRAGLEREGVLSFLLDRVFREGETRERWSYRLGGLEDGEHRDWNGRGAVRLGDSFQVRVVSAPVLTAPTSIAQEWTDEEFREMQIRSARQAIARAEKTCAELARAVEAAHTFDLRRPRRRQTCVRLSIDGGKPVTGGLPGRGVVSVIVSMRVKEKRDLQVTLRGLDSGPAWWFSGVSYSWITRKLRPGSVVRAEIVQAVPELPRHAAWEQGPLPGAVFWDLSPLLTRRCFERALRDAQEKLAWNRRQLAELGG